jgi:PAS domain S-box-containing protein
MSEQRFTAVIVDDAPDVRHIVRLELELSGKFLVVGEGSTGREAIELAASCSPSVLLLDISMPDLDGLQALPAVLSASPETRVVIFSGFDAETVRSRALELGASAYVEKGAAISELPVRLLGVLGADKEATDRPKAGLAKPAFYSVEKDRSTSNARNRLSSDPGAVFAEHLERFRTTFDQAAIGMSTLTLNGTIVRANDALARLLGVTPVDLVGRSYGELAAEPDRADVALILANAVRQPAEPSQLEHRLAPASPPRWAKSTVGAVIDSTGRPLYLFAQTEDITRRHEATEELRASEERFRLMVESVQDYAIFMLDAEGHITTWNLGAQRLKGYTAEEICGRHFRVFYPKEVADAGHPEEELAIAVRDGRYEEEGWRVRKDGTRFWANVVITALFDPNKTLIGFAKVTRDMTERRRAAAELEASNHQLALSASQTEEFVAVTAHELQSPVTVISGTVDLLRQYWDRMDAAERNESLERIRSGGRRIRRLLNDLLTASRLDAGSFELSVDAVNLEEVVAQATREASPLGSHVDTAGVVGHVVLADSERLVQILTNLLTNATKYGKPPIAVDARAAGDMVEVAVRDHGDGVPDALVASLFQKFSRSSSGNRGVGLGLFITRELARLQGGDARYERVPPQSSFIVSLPAAR